MTYLCKEADKLTLAKYMLFSAVDWSLNPKSNGFFVTNWQSQNNICLNLLPTCFLQQNVLLIMPFNL